MTWTKVIKKDFNGFESCLQLASNNITDDRVYYYTVARIIPVESPRGRLTLMRLWLIQNATLHFSLVEEPHAVKLHI